MEAPTKLRPLGRWWLLATGGLLGLLASYAGPGPTGCIYHDTCIKVTSPGHDWCRYLANAKMWPAGTSIEQAEPVLSAEGTTPKGCRCFNDAEDKILYDQVPACRYEQALEEIELAAREQCQLLVLPGYDHNCWTSAGAQASTPELPFFDAPGSCIGNCEYGGPPSGGSCPDPTPYECATGDGGQVCDTEDSADGGTSSDTGSEESGSMVLDHDGAISCEANVCEIDEHFARQLYADPSPIVMSGVHLVYDRVAQRHTFAGIEPSSVLHALGLRNGDRLEHVGGLVIDDLDAALHAYTENRDADTIEVRVLRADQWVDFTYTFVR